MAAVADLFAQAWKYHQAGDFAPAEMAYRQALQVDPNHVDSWCFLGAVFQAQRKILDAENCFRRAISLMPDHPSAKNCLGVLLAENGQLEEAGNIFQELAWRQPSDAEVCNNLGQVRARQGRWHEAAAQYRQALALRPDYLTARQNLMVALPKAGQANQTATPPTLLDQDAARLAAESTAHNDRGADLARQGRLPEAAVEIETALRIQPTNANARNNLGTIYYYGGHYDRAIECFRQAVQLKPDHAEAHSNLGNLLLLKGHIDEALASCRESVRLKPDSPGNYLNLGNALREKSMIEECVACYRQVLRFLPENVDAHNNLAGLFQDQGDFEQARVHYNEAVRLRPSNGLRILRDTLLPHLYQSNDDLCAWRQRLTDNVHRLREEGVRLDITTEMAQPPFNLAYQGCNDRELQRKLAGLYCPPTNLAPARGPRAAGRRLKVGFISKYFRIHTIGHWMRGLVAQLSRNDFEVTVLSVGHYDDEIARFFKQQADHYLEVPKHLPSARKLIADLQLDVLFYTDIGMDPVTYTLAFSRLAPVQCVTLGHPVTTGIETVDYYISSETLETDDAQQHYTETLVRLKTPPIYFYRSVLQAPFKERKAFGLAKEDHIYACMQTVFKFHPDFDALLGGILRGDPRAKVVMSRWKVPRWEQLLRQRFEKTLSDVVDRIHFLPMLDYRDYMNVLALADVQLDTYHFGGGSTSYDAFTVGTPIVTLPTEFLRGRITQSMYKQMGILDCVAQDAREYIDIAIRLGTKPDYRQALRKKILEANEVLFENIAGVRELEVFLRNAVARSVNQPDCALGRGGSTA